METAVVIARIAQFIGAAILFGTPLFFLYALPKAGVGSAMTLPWPRPVLGACALAVIVAAIVYLCSQTAMMADDPAAAFDRETLLGVLNDSAMGHAVVARLAAALAALVACLVLKPGRILWAILAALGAAVMASFAWTGHGAVDEGLHGLIHTPADVLHLLAAGVWLGALTAFAILLCAPGRASLESQAVLHRALEGFSGIGSAVVAVILVTGLINSWFLVGLAGIARMGASTYGVLLLVKIALFAAMIGLAGLNRFFHTPALARGLDAGDAVSALKTLRVSIILETLFGLAVVLLVAILGMLAPVAAQ
ncbi:copper homeostasis membrane protein CopD [Phenylobacterium sp.]|uniref:copper homeostasis membrane protein CopD n=1 Tax=Phenylobacterium sp. TaxID=1871053 RepID=UPI003564D1CD